MENSKELSKELMCICIRGGAEIWLEKEKAEALMGGIENGAAQRFVKIDNQFVNVADIQGIFNTQTMQEKTMIKNGYWKCVKGNYWHKKYEECAHGRKL